MKRLLNVLCCILACVLLIPVGALANLKWPQPQHEGQRKLFEYVDRVNEDLSGIHYSTINSIFELYTFNAALGITAADRSDIPETTEFSFTMYSDSLNKLVFRTSDINLFEGIAACLIHAASPHVTTLDECRTDPAFYVAKVKKAPDNSF